MRYFGMLLINVPVAVALVTADAAGKAVQTSAIALGNLSDGIRQIQAQRKKRREEWNNFLDDVMDPYDH